MTLLLTQFTPVCEEQQFGFGRVEIGYVGDVIWRHSVAFWCGVYLLILNNFDILFFKLGKKKLLATLQTRFTRMVRGRPSLQSREYLSRNIRIRFASLRCDVSKHHLAIHNIFPTIKSQNHVCCGAQLRNGRFMSSYYYLN